MQLWRLLDLLVEQVTPTLLHDIIRHVVTVADADEVALFAGDTTPLLIAAHGRRVFAEQAGLVDRRLERAAGMGQVVELGGADDTTWQTDSRTVVHHGLWVPAPPEAVYRVVLRVLRARPQPFTPGTADLLQLVTKRLASVVSQRHDQQSTNLQHVERAQLFLVSASVAQELDPGSVAQRVARGLTAVTDFATATVELVDGDHVRRVAVDGDGAARGDAGPLDSWRATLRDDRAIGELSYRIQADRSLPAGAGDRVTAPGVVTQLLDQRGDTFGFLTLSQPRTGADLTPQMVLTIELFARQAQLALANAELYHEATHQRDAARTLTRLTSALSTSLDTAAVLDTCCDAALSLSAGDRASIFLVDKHGMVRHGATAPRTDAGRVDWSPRALDDCSLLGHAARGGGPVLVDDLPASSFADAAVVGALDLQGAALYPLRTDDTTVGLLLIDGRTSPVSFGPDEVAQLSQIANQTAVALQQAALHERTREQADRAARLLELTTALTTTLDFTAIFRRIVEALRGRLEAHAVSVLQVDAVAMRVLGTMVDGTIRCPRPPLRVPIDDTLAHALDLVWERGTLRIEDIRDCPAWSSIATASTRAVILAAPLDRAETDVLLTVSSTSGGAFTGDDEQFLGDLARVTQLAVRNAELFDQVSDSARRDPLTGLLNRRAFWTQLQQRLEALEGTDTVALAVIDADDFKAINDRFGHAVGDAVLGHIAERLRATVRNHGDVFRIGGEEFTVIMPDATADQARRVMEHVTRLIRDGHGELPALSVSAGVAVAPVNGRTADALFSEADRALLDAKRRGKDRVELRRAVA